MILPPAPGKPSRKKAAKKRQAKTVAERQRAYRARKASESLQEVRGIFARPEHHPAIKNAVTALRAHLESTEPLDALDD